MPLIDKLRIVRQKNYETQVSKQKSLGIAVIGGI
jgi:hypothetical protein